jgi:predicted ArsR family transcriptional regulator
VTAARPHLTDAKRKVLETLKRAGRGTAQGVADALGITAVAARQHLTALEESGLVRSERTAPQGRGRPSIEWSLTESGDGLFPDRHGDLAVELIEAIRRTAGEDTLLRIVEVRARDQLNLYRTVIPPEGVSLKKRVEALAAQRTAEGYMAEVVQERPGTYLLIEHHCPICDAARSCTGLCKAELRVFRQTLGKDVEIERTTHLLADGDRCVYRIRPKRKR